MPRNARTSLYQNFSASPGGKCYHLSISPMVLHWKFLLTHWVLVSLCSLKSVLVVFCLNASIGECRTREKLSTVTTPFLQQKLLSIKKRVQKNRVNVRFPDGDAEKPYKKYSHGKVFTYIAKTISVIFCVLWREGNSCSGKSPFAIFSDRCNNSFSWNKESNQHLDYTAIARPFCFSVGVYGPEKKIPSVDVKSNTKPILPL